MLNLSYTDCKTTKKKKEAGQICRAKKPDRKSSEINFARKFVYYAPTTDKEVSSSLAKAKGERGGEGNFIESPLCAENSSSF